MKRLAAILTCLMIMAITTIAFAASITITGSDVVAKGKTVTLKASQDVTWKSSNKKIATISSSGKVKGIKAGKVTITATTKDGKKQTWKMTVAKKPAKSVEITGAKDEMNVGDKLQLKAVASPSDAAQSFTWKSSNRKAATVDENGMVTAVKEGKAKITATAKDGSGKKATISLTIRKKAEKGNKVGISMPTKDFQLWYKDGIRLSDQLKASGYDVELQYASNDLATQVAQVEKMIDNGCGVLIITAVDGTGLNSALDKADAKGIKVIAYDRLLIDTNAVDYYVTFDNYSVGTIQGKYVKKALDLEHAKGPFYIEFTAGDPGDNNAAAFFSGAYDILRPYIRNGKIIVKSGQTEFSEVATPTWRSEVAQKRAETILHDYYADGSGLDAWVCSNDSTAAGVIHALEKNYKNRNWPIITGQDCDYENVRYIAEGKQAMSVLKDTRILVSRTVRMVGQIMRGEDVDINDTETYNNNKKNVPAYLCSPVYADANNYRELLVDTGYYDADMLK